jgi:hypothetical protein
MLPIALRYIYKIRNTQKRLFANAWYRHCLYGEPIEDHYDISVMVRQSVRLRLAEYGVNENNTAWKRL